MKYTDNIELSGKVYTYMSIQHILNELKSCMHTLYRSKLCKLLVKDG